MTWPPVTVTAPAANPWDTADIAARAMAVLRLDQSDQDAGRIREHAATACDKIDGYLDLTEPYPADAIPGAVQETAVSVTVELYRRKDAPFGILDSWSADGVFARVPSDPLRMHEAVLSRYKARQGVA